MNWKAYVYLGELFCLHVKGTDAIEFEKKIKWNNETMKQIKTGQSCLVFSREHQVHNWIEQHEVKINFCWISHVKCNNYTASEAKKQNVLLKVFSI